MKWLRISLTFFAVAPFTLVLVSLANAQPNRTWVSGVGDDMNPCSRTSPCKTFAGAISKTAVGGEINCLDSGDFGSATIFASLTIDCGGTLGSILSGGITITAYGINDVVTIRNLSIRGGGGIIYSGAKSVHLENVTVSDVDTGFISETASGQLTVDNSTFSDCQTGIVIGGGSPGVMTVDIHNTRIMNCLNGIFANVGLRVNVRDSVISMNTFGIRQVGSPGGSTVLVTGSTLALNQYALLSVGMGGFIGASGNTFSNNTVMVYGQQAGGQIYTGNDNILFGNAATGSVTGVLPKN